MHICKTELIQLWFYLGDGFSLINGESFHQPSVLLIREKPGFLFTAWPLKFSFCKPFVAEQLAITFVKQCFHAVTFSSTEKE